MFIIDYFIRNLIEEIENLSQSMCQQANKELNIEALKPACDNLVQKFKELVKLLPDLQTDRIEALKRHLEYIKAGVKQKRMSHLIVLNLEDIINYDVPGIKKAYNDYIDTFSYLDPDLMVGCKDLIKNREWDSAIRKGFIIIKEKSHKKYPNLPTDIDKIKLVNKLFSRKGLIRVFKEDKKQETFRQWCEALYKCYRNNYAHNLTEDESYMVEAVLSSINLILKVIAQSK